MSRNELKKKIDEANVKLCDLLSINHYNLQRHEIIRYSQQLDELIVAYMKSLS
ncbi:aspartyl-phosphate phosphatase Spo0E family protein [Marinisporobacter balticus]|uniref:Spo0E like sporulation regulatory protein n=1 Tax=Marinisporobacter balticus TaxID=2018667 RepID=A0A4R2KQL5_9FIRM|nr:aspartyl-phosphate phosphatase Spo0E family protein [Marinisporobacter balticus]TCO74977.1 Spo0E like sporulation regulatory protein [Marinisporobacter balticus]